MPSDQIISANIRGFNINFKTKPGVFSKQGIDVGSRLLAETVRIKDGTQVADLGCGSGVIGFVAAKLNPRGHVHLLEVNLRFVKLAEENTALNNLKNVEVYLSDLFSAVEARTYHLIVSNPPQHLGNEFLEEMVKKCFLHLKIKGEVWWVVQKHLKPVIERLFKKHFSNCTIMGRGNNYVIIKAVKDG